MNSKLLPRMIALAVVIFLGVYYIVFDVMQYRVTSQPFPVTVLMSSAGGLYSGADVTYQGSAGWKSHRSRSRADRGVR